jgi:pyruvate dehydrogenase E2 component (dihydrolipoamide acetyltransferase)
VGGEEGWAATTTAAPRRFGRRAALRQSASNAPPPAPGRVRATPPVRKLAKELGVDLSAVAGTGPEGRITREDVRRAGGPVGTPAEGPDVERVPVRGVRRLIAEKMARSVREIPHVTTFLTVDATTLQAFRDHVERRTGVRVSPLAVTVAALCRTLRDHPALNASFDAERAEIVLHRRVHVGIATDTDQGLLAPVVRDADRLTLTDLAARIAALAQGARQGRLAPEDLTGSTITVSNVGTFGAEFGTPIINHPEGAIVALGVMAPRALVVDGRVEARPALTLSLSFDHRLLDGAQAGRAARALADLLEDPFGLGALAL